MDTTLAKWKKDPYRQPLLLTGIRGVGKTTTVLHFANDNYKNVLYLNLENEDSKEFVQKATFSHARTEEDFIKFVDKYILNCPNIFTKEGMSLRLYCIVGGFPAVSKAIYLRQEWTTALAQVIDNLEKDFTDTKRQRLHARYLLKFLLNFVIQTRSTGTEQLKALAQEINEMLEPLASITELEVYLLIERLQDLGILRGLRSRP